jgi:hypothetical protein
MSDEKEYPLDEGLPPASEEKALVDDMIQYEVSTGTASSAYGVHITVNNPTPGYTPPTVYTGIVDRVKSLFTKPEPATGFKAYGDHWLAVYSNNFEDREGEIFPAKAIDAYIGRVKAGIVPMPELWLWHVPGTKIGQTEIIERVGAFVVAGGSFDSSTQGQAAKAAFAKDKDNAMSHGFTYDAKKFDGRHYWSFNTFEISVLPRKAAANAFTSFEEIENMAMTAELKTWLKTHGVDDPDKIEGNLGTAEKALVGADVAYKDFTAVPDDEPAVSEKTIEAANKAFGVLVTDLTESLADVAQVQETGAKALAGYKAQVDAQIATLSKSVSDLTALVQGMVNARPTIASRDDSNVIDNSTVGETIKKALLDDDSKYEMIAGVRARKLDSL